MAGKLDWDRIAAEERVRRHGVARDGDDLPPTGSAADQARYRQPEPRKPRRRKRKPKVVVRDGVTGRLK